VCVGLRAESGIHDKELRGEGCGVWGVGFRVWCVGFDVMGLGCRVWCVGFGVNKGLRFQIDGLRFKA
jgi:hypothetical protein